MAVTANQLIVSQKARQRVSYPIVTAVHIYSGTLVFSVAASGFATNAIAAGANHFLGIAAEDIDNPGASGDKRVEVFTEGVFQMKGTSLTQAMVGDKIYGIDNFAVDATSASQTLVGICVEYVNSTTIMVKLEVGIA